MRIVITGANGYLGVGVVKKLLDNGHDVIALDKGTERVDERAVRVDCDIFQDKDCLSSIDNIDVLLHMAWRDGFVHYSDSHIIDLPKHFSFLETAISSGIKHISVMGSMHEVGFWEGPIKENTPCNPVTPYGISKNALKQLLLSLSSKHKDLVFQWLRAYYIVGNSVSGNSVFSKIVQKSIDGEREFPFTMGQNQYDFTDYDLFCDMVSCCVCQNRINGIIELCSGKPEKLADRTERFIKENGYNIKLKYGAFPDRPYDSQAVWGDASKINSIMRGM